MPRYWWRFPAIGLVAMVYGSCATMAPRANRHLAEKVGDLDLFYAPGAGASLKVRGVPVFSGTSLWVVKPQWRGHYYGVSMNPDLIRNATVEDWRGGRRITLHHKGLPATEPDKPCPFEGTETFVLLPDNTYSATMEFTFSQDVPAWIEWGVGCFNPSPIIGCSYAAQFDKKRRGGIIPVEAKSVSVPESTVAHDFRSLSIESRLGPMVIEASPETPLRFLDYRKNVYADANKPMFWAGLLDQEFKPLVRHTYSVTMRFGPAPTATVQGPAATARPALIATDWARVPKRGADYIIPKPKQVRFTGGALPLTADTTIYVGANLTPGIHKALAFLMSDLKRHHGLQPKVVRDEPPASATVGSAILLGEKSRFGRPAERCEAAGLTLPSHPEGYSLLVTPEGAFVAAESERGVFCGVTTLVQLLDVSDKGTCLRGAEIVDYPSLDFRGIHCLTGKGKGDEIARAVRDLMARFKINTLVWECEYIQWDSHPELWHKQYGMTKDDARKVIRAAEGNMVEIIPLIQSLGHSEWVFANGQHLDLAEDPARPYHTSPTNPKSYELMFSVYQEALEFFHPRTFHIGHDEVTNDGRFPYRSLSSGKSITRLILDDTRTYYDWLKQRNVRTMMWGDMFLYETEAPDACNAPSLEEARARRDQLPRDAIIADWHYEPAKPEQYTSIRIWKDEGFPVVGAGWDRSANIRNLAKACEMSKALGYLQTTWAGFNFGITDNEASWRQYWSFILAAYYSWSGDDTPEEQLPFRASEIMIDLWSGEKKDIGPRPGFFVDLRPVANRALEDTPERTGWMGLGPDCDLSRVPVGVNPFGSTRFSIEKNDREQAAVLLAGKLNPPGEYPSAVDLAFEPTEATALHFLMVCGLRAADNARAGTILITLEDRSSGRVDLVYGKTLFATDDYRVGQNAQVAWHGETRAGEKARAWDLVWRNPTPEKRIRAIRIESANTDAAPVLLAITGVK